MMNKDLYSRTKDQMNWDSKNHAKNNEMQATKSERQPHDILDREFLSWKDNKHVNMPGETAASKAGGRFGQSIGNPAETAALQSQTAFNPE